jgi:hypothetical protein
LAKKGAFPGGLAVAPYSKVQGLVFMGLSTLLFQALFCKALYFLSLKNTGLAQD